MGGTGLNAFMFLISSIFNFYIMVLFIRLMLGFVNADYNHPLTQFVIKLTSFIVKPMKKLIPDVRGIEIATIVLIILVIILKFLVLMLISYGIPNLLGLLILAIGDALKLFLMTLSLALIVQVLLSWVMPTSPVYPILARFTSPITQPLQKVIPLVSGVDITPLVALLILQLLVIIVANPIISSGIAVAVRA